MLNGSTELTCCTWWTSTGCATSYTRLNCVEVGDCLRTRTETRIGNTGREVEHCHRLCTACGRVTRAQNVESLTAKVRAKLYYIYLAYADGLKVGGRLQSADTPNLI